MKIRLDRNETDMIEMVYTIASAPENWEEWKCLHIHDPDLVKIRENETSLMATEAVMASYLDNLEGWVFHNGGADIFILCRHIKERDFLNIGKHILELVLETHSKTAALRLIDLGQDSERFLNIVLNEKHIDTPDIVFKKTTNDQESSLSDNHMWKRVLLVEDDDVTRWMVRRTLKEECFVATATCVRKSYASFKAFQPDITFLDLELPDGTGFEILEWIMQYDPGAYVVIFSSHDDPENRTKALSLGAKGFITKPFLKDKLMAHINQSGQ